MKYQKVRAETYQECLDQIRMDYGPDAIPITKREVFEGGVFGKFFKKKLWEVTVGITEKKVAATSGKMMALERILERKANDPNFFEDDSNRNSRKEKNRDPLLAKISAPISNSFAEDRNEDEKEKQVLSRLYGLEEEYGTGQKKSFSNEAGQVQEKKERSIKLEKDILEIQKKLGLDENLGAKNSRSSKANRSEINSILPQKTSAATPKDEYLASLVREESLAKKRRDFNLDSASSVSSNLSLEKKPDDFLEISNTLSRSESSSVSKNFNQSAHANNSSLSDSVLSKERNIKLIENRLLENDMTENFVEGFLRQLDRKLSPEQKEDKDFVKGKSTLTLAEYIQTEPQLLARREKQKVIMIIGPTGVGKTTTLAKLAWEYFSNKQKTVSLITIDNFRIAATEQLKKYAEIMKIPLHVCRKALEFSETLEEEDAQVILVDTSGRSPGNMDELLELKTFADSCKLPIEKHLVVSATTSYRSLEKIFAAYSKIGFDKIVLSKIDENETIGSFVEVADKYNRPFSFLTNGQDVPNDIIVAESEKIAGFIIDGHGFQEANGK